MSGEIREKLLRMSASTIGRLLADERKRRLKSGSGTKPGTLLKHQVPIRTFSEGDESKPGFVEIDLVSHRGGDEQGDFCQTLSQLVNIICQREKPRRHFGQCCL